MLQDAVYGYVSLHVQVTHASSGDCATCLGPVDGTLGSCAGLQACVSSFDDRPDHFLNPWEIDDNVVRIHPAATGHTIVMLPCVHCNEHHLARKLQT